MTKTESIIHSILGPLFRDVRPFACAIDVAVDQLFLQKLPLDELKLSRHVYPEAAELMRMSFRAIEKSTERMANLCWESGDRNVLRKIIGRDLKIAPHPREMLAYIAYYTRLDIPFYSAIARIASLKL